MPMGPFSESDLPVLIRYAYDSCRVSGAVDVAVAAYAKTLHSLLAGGIRTA